MTGQRFAVRADDGAAGPVGQPPQPEAASREQPGGPVPAGALLQLQRTRGNRYVQRLLQAPGPVVQPQLRLGRAGDRYEREADRLATGLSGEVAGAARRPGPMVQRAGRLVGAGTARAVGQDLAPADSALILGARGRGQPLPGRLRRRCEQGLGASFAPVRLHTDHLADALNRRLGSSAFTTGPDLFFRRGAYDPASATGRELLGHELVHVVQQSADGGGPGLVQLGRKKKKQDGKPGDPAPATAKKPPAQQPGVTKPKPQQKKKAQVTAQKKTQAQLQAAASTGAFNAVLANPLKAVPANPLKAVLANPLKAVPANPLKAVTAKGNPQPAKFVPTLATVPEVSPGAKGKRPRSASVQPAKVAKLNPGEPAEQETRAEIPVGYRDLAGMRKYLATQNLVEGAKVRPISVGVVVWNINHLKADPGADDEAEADESASFDDDLDEDFVVEGEETDTGGDFGTGELPSTVPDYDIDAITAAMTALKNGLKQASAEVYEAIDQEITDLDSAVSGSGRKARSETRKEVSQVRRDIGELIRFDLSAVLAPGIAAMGQAAQQAGQSAVEAQATQLDQVRALNRVWKRLTRLRAILFTGNVKSPLKWQARENIRAALPKKAGRTIAGAIDRLLAALPVRDLAAAGGSLKRRAVIGMTTGTFFANPAVNLVLVNEMNLGIRHLETAVAASQGALGLSRGPVMVARGTQGAGTAGITIGTGDDEQQVIGKQYEYYPATHRSAGPGALVSAGTFYVSTAGHFAVQDGGQKSNEAIGWNKTQKTFRGIVVHRYVQGQQEFWAGIIHTTPAGKDLDRKRIWPQIRVPLRALGQLAGFFSIPLLIGGDFYIPAEGIVSKPAKELRDEIKRADPTLMLNVKLWNTARNVFLAAEATGQIPQLLKSVKAEPVERGGKQEQAADYSRHAWLSYCAAVKPEIEILKTGENPGEKKAGKKRARGNPAGEKLDVTAALAKLAPEMPKLQVGISWKQTVAAGDISGLDIIRNSQLPAARITMERALGPMGYRMVAAGSPTNPKEHGRGDNKMQIADLFIVNRYWQTTHSGIVVPATSELKTIDDPELSASKTYWKVSDHSPVLMTGSTVRFDPVPYQAFRLAREVDKLVVAANQTAWDIIGKRLAGLKTTGKPVAAQVAAIKTLLNRPLLGPTLGVTDQVQKLAHALGLSIINAMSAVFTPAQKLTLDDLRDWAPLYSVDVIGEPLPGVPPGSTPAGNDSSAGLLTLPGSAPAGLTKPDLTKPGLTKPAVTVPAGPGNNDQEMADAQSPWPMGEMEHGYNTCYLAALVHVLASHQRFADLLDPHAHLPQQQASVSFQAMSGLHSLVTRLRDAQATISAADTLTFMRYLDEMGTMLTGESGYTRAEEYTKQTSQVGRQAVAAKRAYGLQQDASEVLTRVLAQLEAPATVKPSIESHLTEIKTSQVSVSPEQQSTITLSIGPGVKTMTDALRHYSAAEVVDYGDPLTPHRKQLKFGSLPEVLTLVLSRFTKQATKINRPVAVDEVLDIPDACLSPALQGQQARYRLLHMVHHFGETMVEGHYTSFGRAPGTGQWYHHDDNAMGPRRTWPGQDTLTKALNTGYVYIYERI